MEQLIEETVRGMGRLDYIFNNAGIVIVAMSVIMVLKIGIEL